jgi:alpha-ketoglutarate-dependent dioxygenase alkB family protein 2
MKRSLEEEKTVDVREGKRVKLMCRSTFKNLQLPMASVEYTEVTPFSETDLVRMTDSLVENITPLFQPTFITVYGKTYEERRRVIGLGTKGVKYSYSGRTVDAVDWEKFPSILEIRDKVIEVCNMRGGCPKVHVPNFVLINWYRNGNDKLGPHKDDERDLTKGMPIISFTLGQRRRFVFHTSNPLRKVGEIVLKNGTVLVMNPGTQKHYKHSIPEMKAATGPRWSLTFRYIK